MAGKLSGRLALVFANIDADTGCEVVFTVTAECNFNALIPYPLFFVP